MILTFIHALKPNMKKFATLKAKYYIFVTKVVQKTWHAVISFGVMLNLFQHLYRGGFYC